MSYPRFSCALYMFPPSFFSPILSFILSRRNKVVKSQKGRPRTTKIDTKIAKKKAALGRLKLNANGFCRGTIFSDSPKSGRRSHWPSFLPCGFDRVSVWSESGPSMNRDSTLSYNFFFTFWAPTVWTPLFKCTAHTDRKVIPIFR